MTEEEYLRLYQNFETRRLLDAVDAVDRLRDDLGDDEDGRPPELRSRLLKLHTLAMAVVNEGARSRAAALFELADDLDMQVSQMLTELESIQDTLDALMALAPEEPGD
ncbi:transposase [Deinococcus phoenicis]|nr:transposase [Deinococcus phoenicis]